MDRPNINDIKKMSKSEAKELLGIQMTFLGQAVKDLFNPFRAFRIIKKAFRQLIGKEE